LGDSSNFSKGSNDIVQASTPSRHSKESLNAVVKGGLSEEVRLRDMMSGIVRFRKTFRGESCLSRADVDCSKLRGMKENRRLRGKRHLQLNIQIWINPAQDPTHEGQGPKKSQDCK